MPIEECYTQIKLSTETLMEELQSEVSETNELEFQEKPQAYWTFDVLEFSQSKSRWEQ